VKQTKYYFLHKAIARYLPELMRVAVCFVGVLD
jgi:hypothetical protein